MKEKILIVLLFSFTTQLMSCKNKAENIQVSDLNTPCQFLDVFKLLVSEAEEIKGKKSLNELTTEEKDKYDKLFKKYWEISDLLKSSKFRFKDADFLNCSGISSTDDLKKIRNRIRAVDFD